LINYTLSIEVNGNKIIKSAKDKQDFLRLVMLYGIGNYQQKLAIFNDLVQKSENKLQKIKNN
jgi:hypothetical protein